MPTAAITERAAHSEALMTAAIASASKPQRIPALDFTKGALVLLMVLYHWANYFTQLPSKYYDYLRFLTPSFIFISGYMISHVYLAKYAAADPRLAKRLFTRGLKLIAVFLALNLARAFVVPLLGTGVAGHNWPSLSNIFAVFVSGNFPVVGGKLISFSILVSISYLLMLSGALIVVYRRHRRIFHFTCALFVLLILALCLLRTRSYNLELITFGLLGILMGFMPTRAITSLARHPYSLAASYLCYTIAITIWGVPFLLLVIGVSLSVMVIYLVGAGGDYSSKIRGEILLLGKYSLFGYISQIAILQILSVGLRPLNLGLASLTLSLFVAFILTITSVEIIDRARARFMPVDRVYKAVFS